MATEKQIKANQQNAQSCTGPRSVAGKAISSQNALKTGIDAKSEVIRFESRTDFEALIAEFYTRYHPSEPAERTLVDLLIRSEWLGRRFMAVDTSLWEGGFNETSSASLSLVFARSQELFDKAGRRMNWAQRNFQNALKQLLDLQSKRQSEPESEQAIEIPSPACPAPSPALQEPRLEGAALKTTVPANPATEPLTSKLVSFRPDTPETPAPTQPEPEISAETPAPTPKKEDEPPIAA